MRRRELLATVGGALALPGCTAGYQETQRAAGDDPKRVVETPPLAEQVFPTTVCEEDPKPGGIVAIGDPAFGSIAEWPDAPHGYWPVTDDRTVSGSLSTVRRVPTR